MASLSLCAPGARRGRTRPSHAGREAVAGSVRTSASSSSNVVRSGSLGASGGFLRFLAGHVEGAEWNAHASRLDLQTGPDAAAHKEPRRAVSSGTLG